MLLGRISTRLTESLPFSALRQRSLAVQRRHRLDFGFNQRLLISMAPSKRVRAQLEAVEAPVELEPPPKQIKVSKAAAKQAKTPKNKSKTVPIIVIKPEMIENVVLEDVAPQKESKRPGRAAKVKAETALSEIVQENEQTGSKKGRKKQAVESEDDALEQSSEESVMDSDVPVKTSPKRRGKKGDGVPREATEGRKKAVAEALARPPPTNSDYLPLPWKGRLGYACLNTYLRNSTPPVFSGRTCRIASIEENQYPLKDPSKPFHPEKNPRDKKQPPDLERGMDFVKAIGLANAKDIIPMMKWNDKYGIKFLRLSSEMFPYASHEKYGYQLAPFAAEVLAETGKLAAKLGHRLTTHPGQFTQLASPRESVIAGAIRDLEYHDEMLSLLKLPKQENRDAVMILHMGGAFDDKAATLDRFRKNYATLSQSIKNRIVLENDDVNWSVHDLLPICQELNIPLVLDYHHNNIVYDETKMREGTLDIMNLYPEISETWRRKGIRQKMHYSEPEEGAITKRDRIKHSPRVKTLPPCPDNMDLMIEAKDKEQAVFELMRQFKLPGWEKINDIIPHVREDINLPVKPVKAAKPKKAKKAKKGEEEDVKEEVDEVVEDVVAAPPKIPDEEVGMGGPENRVYWPEGSEEWLRPVVKKRPAKTEEEVETAIKAPAARKVKAKRKTVKEED